MSESKPEVKQILELGQKVRVVDETRLDIEVWCKGKTGDVIPFKFSCHKGLATLEKDVDA